MADEARNEALLRRMSVSLPLPEPEPERAERIATRLDYRLAELVADDAARARRRRWLHPLMAAASMLLLIGAGWFAKGKWVASEASEGSFELLNGRLEVAERGVAQDRAQEFRVGQEEAQVVLPSGARLQLEPATIFSVSSKLDGEEVFLPSGKVALTVPQLGPRRLTVTTGEALITVRGTRFTVERTEGEARTRVAVSEGSVEVRAGREVAILGPGGFWEFPPRVAVQNVASAAPTTVEPSEPVEVAAVRPRGSLVRHVPQHPDAAAPVASSSLPAENKLFRAAARAKARSDFATALSYFDELLRNYPESPLAQNAEVERFRVLQAMQQDEAAAQAAREYLSRHADGFARAEAKDVALRPLPLAEPKSPDGK